MQPHQSGNDTYMCLILRYVPRPWSIILTVKQNDCVKQKKNICLKHVPSNQIVVSVKIKIATVDFWHNADLTRYAILQGL